MKSEKIRRIVTIIATLVIMNLIKNLLLYSAVMSLLASTIGDGRFTAILAVLILNIIVGACSMIPLYLELYNNSEEKRRFLAYFSDNEYNRVNLRVYQKKTGVVRQDSIVYLLALLVVLIIRYAEYIITSPIYFLDFALEFAILFGVYIFYNMVVRQKLYDKWEKERLHR